MFKPKFTLATLLVLALALVWAFFSSQERTTVAQTTQDEEIAYVDSAARIRITDPYTAAGNAPFTWVSPTSGYSTFAVLDANGDGVDEIVAIKGNTVELLTPFTPQGTTPPTFSRTIGSGFIYDYVAAGDFVPGDGGRDEILVQRTDNRNNSSFSVQIYNGDPTGTAWNLVYDETFGIPWIEQVAGNVDGLEGDEIIQMRNGPITNRDKRLKIIKFAPNNTFVTLFDKDYDFPWLALDAGNTHDQNNGPIEEIVTSREDVLGQLPSLLVFQYSANKLFDAPNGQRNNFPYWEHMALGDVNASGDEELFVIRDPKTDGGISLVGFNWGSDTFPAAWTSGLPLGRTLQAVAAGDVDGDSKAEVIVARPGAYRIYTEPGANLNHSGDQAASFRSPIVLGLGNFDGSGISTDPQRLAVNKTFMQFEMTRGEADPPSQTFEVTNVGGGGAIAYDVNRVINGDWLRVEPFNAATPRTHTVSINGAGLAAGTYDGTIIVRAENPAVENSPQEIQVRLVVRATGPLLDVSPTSISLTMNYGGLLPDEVPLVIRNVGDGGPQNYALQITTDDGINWIVASKLSGRTDDTSIISIDPSRLSSGEYSGNIRVDAGDIEGSPVDIPVSLVIEPTGMEVTPRDLYVVVHKGLTSPRAEILVDQAVPGSAAVTWYAYAVPAGSWSAAMRGLEAGDLEVRRTDDAFVFTDAEGTESVVQYLPWVILTPSMGITPGILQLTFDVAAAPIGDNRVTIIVDGGPGTPNRFQGVDTTIIVGAVAQWLPTIMR